MPKIKFKFYFYSVGNFVVDLKKVNVKNMFSQAAEGLPLLVQVTVTV